MGALFFFFSLSISCLIERALALCLTVIQAERREWGAKVEDVKKKGKKSEAVSHINETFRRYINKVSRLSGLAPSHIYISTFERTPPPVPA